MHARGPPPRRPAARTRQHGLGKHKVGTRKVGDHARKFRVRLLRQQAALPPRAKACEQGRRRAARQWAWRSGGEQQW